MTAVLTKIIHKRVKSLQPTSIKEYTEQNLEDLISTINEKEIESLYNNQELLYLKQRLLVHRIRQLRNDSALKIQGMWNRYQTRLKVHKLAHRVRGCYTISPSIKNVTKIAKRVIKKKKTASKIVYLVLMTTYYLIGIVLSIVLKLIMN